MLHKNRLRLAIQKSGRLSNDSYDLLIRCGIKINLKKSSLVAFSENMPIDVFLVRDDDIPGLVMDGIVDLGIVGSNVLKEKHLNRLSQGLKYSYSILQTLDFGSCRLSLAVPIDMNYSDIHCLQNLRIATSYPYLLNNYLKHKGLSFKTIILNGSVEVALSAGLSDVICDLVSSGATLEANNLKEVEVIYNSNALMISCDENICSNFKKDIVFKLITRIRSLIRARESKYIMFHISKKKLKSAISLLKGIEHPTVLELSGNLKKVAVHTVSSENIFWETMESLKLLGASSILVLPIEKMLE